MGIIKDFIRKKEEEIIGNSNVVVIKLNDEWGSFLKRDTYLTYDSKAHLLNLVEKGF